MFSSSRALWVSTSLAAAVALGCGADGGQDAELMLLAAEESDGASDVRADPVDAETDDAIGLRDPNEPRIVEVFANGTGCPKGSYEATIAEDGRAAEVSFDAYDASVASGRELSVADCLVSIRVQAPANVQYALNGLDYAGTSQIGRGVNGFFSTKSYFQGNPIGEEARSELKAGSRQGWVSAVGSRRSERDLSWSPCGADRLLQLQSRVQLRGARRSVVRVEKLSILPLAFRTCE